MDRNYIRSLLDRLDVPTRLDDDGDLMVTLDADNDFPHDLFICIVVEDGNRINLIGAAPDYHPEEDLYVLANRHNNRANYPTAVVRSGSIRMEYSFFIDEEVSDEYIKYDCLKRQISAFWNAFVNLEKADTNND